MLTLLETAFALFALCAHSVKTVSPADAAQLLAAGALLVDVRGAAAAARGGPSAPRFTAVPWAHNREFADACLFAAGERCWLAAVLMQRSALTRAPAGASPIVLCDSAGAMSARAATELVHKCKNDVYVIEGGLQAWVVRYLWQRRSGRGSCTWLQACC
jgi:rhodanese-related sulfurtransferase